MRTCALVWALFSVAVSCSVMGNETGRPVPYAVVPVPAAWALGEKPAFVVVTERNWQEFYAALPQGSDFSKSLYVVACLGVQPNPGYRVRIVQISQDGHNVEVLLERLRPEPGRAYPQMLVHPIAVAEVKRSSLQPGGTLEFSFIDQTRQLVAQSKLEP